MKGASPFEIRKANSADAEALSDLGRRTFFETFEKDNTPEDMEMYLTANYSPAKQLAEINDPKRSIKIVWANGKAVGFSHMVAGVPHEAVQKTKSIELSKLYVDSKFHGQGLGRALMQECLTDAKALKFDSMWLSVWEKNEKAFAFYKAFGFNRVGQQIFVVGTDRQTDYIVELPL